MAESTSTIDDSIGTTLLMSGSAVFLGALGLSLSFFPEMVLSHVGIPAEGLLPVLLNMMGAIYLGFAGLNWMARHHLIGGIYSRPVSMGNFIHFFVAAVGLLKYVIQTDSSVSVAIVAGGYTLFAAGFTYIAFSRGASCG